MNVSAEMIAQFFKRMDPSQDIGSAKSSCECGCLLCRSWDLALCHAFARPKDVRPPGKQCFHHDGAALQVKTFGQRLVVFLAFFEPGAVRCILVARLLLL